MPLDISGLDQLRSDIASMASRMDADGAGASTAKHVLETAAVPIHTQMRLNATRDPRRRTGDLYAALQIGKVKRRRRGGQHITIGAHRKDWKHNDYYAAYVEFGHGGPAPAPAHPYIRPAYDARADESYEIIREGLGRALSNR